ncbi:MAG: hypothetical protein P4L50_11060 [Anaerolineaceae bacterium]|nr:hypothetical protein [Anaerolineaceae bacterium]
MAKKTTVPHGLLKSHPSHLLADPNSPLTLEYQAAQRLFDVQPTLVQRFLEAQARQLADAILHNQLQASFNLPDKVVVEIAPHGKQAPLPVPGEFRPQTIGGVINRLTRIDLRTMLRQNLAELEECPERPVAVSAGLLRYALVIHMVYNLLPSGRSVSYQAAEGEEIPTIPYVGQDDPESAILDAGDAVAEAAQGEGASQSEGRGQLQVPFVPAARRFYLPQWVAFDGDCHLLVNSVNEAESHLTSMQMYLSILHGAVSLAPYIVADTFYQQKRYGMLGQLVNQGRALAQYETMEMIQTIQRRAAAHDLNRGLSLSLPYFDDQDLQLRTHDFEVIPGGRIMFVPAFVVRAARQQQAMVAQDTRLSLSTRKYLLAELETLEKAFITPVKD